MMMAARAVSQTLATLATEAATSRAPVTYAATLSLFRFGFAEGRFKECGQARGEAAVHFIPKTSVIQYCQCGSLWSHMSQSPPYYYPFFVLFAFPAMLLRIIGPDTSTIEKRMGTVSRL